MGRDCPDGKQSTIRTERPDWQPWVLFFLRALQQQMKRLAKKVEREKILLAALPEISAAILVPHANMAG